MNVNYFILLILVAGIDQLTKYFIQNHMYLYESREMIPGFFNLVFVTNTGAAFSIFADVESPARHYFFVAIGVIALIGISVWYYSLRKENKYYAVCLGLIAGGALGNLIDRIHIGAVVDFLDFYIKVYHWPAFNVADSAICVGVALFIFINYISEKQKKQGLI